jgi:hypothetical protein
MQYKTKEMYIKVHSNNIIELSSTEEAKGVLTLEEVDNNLAVIEEATKGKIMASLVHISNAYVKKEVLKKYSDLDFGIIAVALLVNSYASKLIGNLFLTLVLRFSSKQIPTKIFTVKEEAVQWLEEKLAKEKEGL